MNLIKVRKDAEHTHDQSSLSILIPSNNRHPFNILHRPLTDLLLYHLTGTLRTSSPSSNFIHYTSTSNIWWSFRLSQVRIHRGVVGIRRERGVVICFISQRREEKQQRHHSNRSPHPGWIVGSYLHVSTIWRRVCDHRVILPLCAKRFPRFRPRADFLFRSKFLFGDT